MPFISVTNSFTNATTADATQVNTNFTDIINGTSDGTKNIQVLDLTALGNTVLGNSTSDSITISARFSSDLDPTTAATYSLGDATQTWKDIYLNNGATDGGAVYFDGTSTMFLKALAAGVTLEFEAGANSTFLIDSSTGNSTLTLRVNNAAANAWDIYNDNSNSDALTFDYNALTQATLVNGTTDVIWRIRQQSTGDASLALRVNNNTANEWKFTLDNSADDDLVIGYGGTGAYTFDDNVTVPMRFDASNIAVGSTPTVNTLYTNMIPKAWASTDAAATIDDGVNLACSTGATGIYDYTFKQNLSSANYCIVHGANHDGLAGIQIVGHQSRTVSGFTIRNTDDSAGTLRNDEHTVFVIGEQT